MIYTPKITSDIQINSLNDLIKLKPFLEDSTLKINKSQIARELGKDRRTVDKYLKGYEKPTARFFIFAQKNSYKTPFFEIL